MNTHATRPVSSASPFPRRATHHADHHGRNGTSSPIGSRMNRSPTTPRSRPRDAVPPAGSGDPSLLAHALRATQESLIALQKLSEQTAQLHRQFLDGQDKAQLHLPDSPGTPAETDVRIDRIGRTSASSPGSLPGFDPIAGPGSRQGTGPAAIRSAGRPPPSSPRPPPSRRRWPRPRCRRRLRRIRSRPPPRRWTAAQAVLLEVVAEKTGYPAEMLELGMQLDADLGIDSIKRVEILSALQERLPEAPVIGPEHLGTLRTLGQIVEFLESGDRRPGGRRGRSPRAGRPRHRPPAVARRRSCWRWCRRRRGTRRRCWSWACSWTPTWASTRSSGSRSSRALQERLPEAPVIGPEHLGTLRTLGQIVEFLAAAPAAALGSSRPSLDANASQPSPPATRGRIPGRSTGS